jgi:hypothetical protein
VKKYIWGYLFAGIGAVSGIVYLLHANNAASQVVNNFPPLSPEAGTATGDDTPSVYFGAPETVANPYGYYMPGTNPAYNTPESAVPGAEVDEPVASVASQNAVNVTPTMKLTPWPVYLV